MKSEIGVETPYRSWIESRTLSIVSGIRACPNIFVLVHHERHADPVVPQLVLRVARCFGIDPVGATDDGFTGERNVLRFAARRQFAAREGRTHRRSPRRRAFRPRPTSGSAKSVTSWSGESQITRHRKLLGIPDFRPNGRARTSTAAGWRAGCRGISWRAGRRPRQQRAAYFFGGYFFRMSRTASRMRAFRLSGAVPGLTSAWPTPRQTTSLLALTSRTSDPSCTIL
jgi:hypothetical protein